MYVSLNRQTDRQQCKTTARPDLRVRCNVDYILMGEWASSVLRPHQHSIGYTGDGFYRSKDPTNSIKVLKEMLQNTKKTTKTTKYRYT